MSVKRLTRFVLIMLVTLSVFPVDGKALDIDAFIKKASISYEKKFTIDASLDMWNRILDHPVLMARLWDLYEFKPKYRIYERGKGFHISDPSGIEGELDVILNEPVKRIYYGTGKLKNWHIPVSFKGKALFLVNQTYEGGKVKVTLNIYGEGGANLVTDLLLKAISPLLTHYINRRITRNLRDLNILIDDIIQRPEKIRSEIKGRYIYEFDRVIGGTATL